MRLVCNNWDTKNSTTQPLPRMFGREVRHLGQFFRYQVYVLQFRFQAKPWNVFILGIWLLALKVSYKLYIGHRCCTLDIKIIFKISQLFSRKLQKQRSFCHTGEKLFGLSYNFYIFLMILFFDLILQHGTKNMFMTMSK